MTVRETGSASSLIIYCGTGGNATAKAFNVRFINQLPESEAKTLRNHLGKILAGYSYHYIQRTVRALGRYFEWCTYNGTDPSLYSPNLNTYLRCWLQAYLSQTERTFLTGHEDWRILRSTLMALQQIDALPQTPLPPVSLKASKLRRIHRSKPTILDKICAAENIPSLPSNSDSSFFERLHVASSKLFRLFRQSAEKEARATIADFITGRRLIAECEIERLRFFIGQGITTDPNVKADTHSKNELSFFSPQHPDGLKNLLGWAFHENQSLLYDRSFTGSNYVYEHTGGLDGVRRYLGLTQAGIIPFFILILIETGMNVEGLQNARIHDQNGRLALRIPTDEDDAAHISVPKPRAQKVLRKLSRPGVGLAASEIISVVCDMTAPWRTDGQDELWLYPGARKRGIAIQFTSTGFKSEWARFIQRVPHSLPQAPTRADLRVLGGIVTWFDSGGDSLATARYLNNRPTTALRNYVPRELQDAFYAHQIRRFQNLLIIASTQQVKALLMRAARFSTMEELTAELEAIQQDTVLSRSPLMKAAAVPSSTKEIADTQTVFVISAKNVAILERLTGTLQQIQRDSPNFDLDTDYRGFSPRHWIDLRNCVAGAIRWSMDKEHVSLFQQGIALANDPEFQLEFPCLYELMENTHE